MDLDLFFSSPRWKILEILAKEPSSPLEISEKLGTSVSYVSQQLKLLEAGNIVKKRKTGAAEKNKPRTVFSLFNEMLQLTVLMNKLPSRKVVNLTEYHKIILRIWMVENVDLHYHIEKLYWTLEEDLQDIKGIFVLDKGQSIIISSDSRKIKPKIDSFIKEVKGKIACSIVSDSEFHKLSAENLHPIYDPKFLLLGKEVKGGNGKRDEK